MCFGIRALNKQERIAERWTNTLPQILAEPTFLEGGELFEKIWKDQESKKKWPATRSRKTIAWVQYGVVLVDFIAKRIISRQGYTEPGTLGIAGYLHVDYARLLLDQYELDRVVDVQCDFKSLSSKKQKQLWKEISKACEAGTSIRVEALKGYIEVKWAPEQPWVIDHISDYVKPKEKAFGDIKAFLKTYGWKTKTQNARA